MVPEVTLIISSTKMNIVTKFHVSFFQSDKARGKGCCRFFTLLKALAKSNNNLFPITYKSEIILYFGGSNNIFANYMIQTSFEKPSEVTPRRNLILKGNIHCIKQNIMRLLKKNRPPFVRPCY